MAHSLQAKPPDGWKRRRLPSRAGLAFVVFPLLLTGAAVFTGLLIPMLLPPESFGVFTLLTTLVCYTWLLHPGLVLLLDDNVPTPIRGNMLRPTN